MGVRTTKSAARKGGRDVQGRTAKPARTPERTAAGSEPAANPRGVCRDPDGLEPARATGSVATERVAGSGPALPRGSSTAVERDRLIQLAANVSRLAADRLEDCKACRSVVPLHESFRMTIAQRIASGDLLVAHDVIVEAREELGHVLEELSAVMSDTPDAMARLRDIELLKPHYGMEPVVVGLRHAGDIVSQETAGTDASGRERQRNAACAGGCPRATAGQRAGRKSC